MRNRHLIIAIVVAPLLSLLAWYAVGTWLGEKPTPAEAGKAYPLAAKSNCRYPSGECELRNQEFSLTIRAGAAHNDGDNAGRDSVSAISPGKTPGYGLVMEASHPLGSALMSVSNPATDPGPGVMQKLDSEGKHWGYKLRSAPPQNYRIRLVVDSAGSAYYAEASTAFLQTPDAPWSSQ